MRTRRDDCVKCGIVSALLLTRRRICTLAATADLAELASRDPLTGLHNRRHLVEGFASMIAAAERTGDPLAVALFDVDRFKSINDGYGHLARDAVLVGLAQPMGEQAPPEALVARWGVRSSSLTSPAPAPRRDWRSSTTCAAGAS